MARTKAFIFGVGHGIEPQIPIFETCAKHGINAPAVSTANAVHTPGSTQQIDAMAKKHGVTIVSSGMVDY